MAHGGQYLLPKMRECDFGTIRSDRTEGEGERGDAGFDPYGFALVGFLSVLDTVGAEKGLHSLC